MLFIRGAATRMACTTESQIRVPGQNEFSFAHAARSAVTVNRPLAAVAPREHKFPLSTVIRAAPANRSS